MSSLADQLRALVGSAKPAQAMGGMTGQAAQQLSGRAYQAHVQEARALGQQPMSPQAWAQSQGQ